MPEKKVTVPHDFLMREYENACNDWKKKIKKAIPEAFEPELYEFGTSDDRSFTIGDSSREGPLVIGVNAVSKELSGKCLFVNDDDYEMEVKIDPKHGKQVLIFKQKS